MKRCNKCHEVKEYSEFYKHKVSPDGYRYSCKSCNSKAAFAYKESTDGKRKLKNCHLKRRYGISIESYEEMLKDQGGVCFICKKREEQTHQNGKIKDLAVDHCHTTGKVRGLLCGLCNRGLGYFKDNTEYLTNAIEYLTK